MEKYGFIYLWYDRKRKMYYIGSHWGSIDDGYICSSNRMRDAYRRRPDDFKRRVIQNNVSRETLLNEEHKWLNKIKLKELGKKYYNLRKHRWGHWSTDVNRRLTIGQKISEKNKGRKRTSEQNLKISVSMKGKEPWNKGKKGYEIKNLKGKEPWNKGKKGLQVSPRKGIKMTDEQKLKISLAKKGVKHKNKRVYK